MSHPHNRQPLYERILSLRSNLQPVPTSISPELNAVPGIQVVVFDVYGTLLASGMGEISTAESGSSTAAAAVLNRFFPDTDVTSSQIGEALRELIEESHRAAKLSGIDVPEVEIREIWASVLKRLGLSVSEPSAEFIESVALEYELRSNPTALMPGATEILTSLISIGYPVAVVSNAQFYTEMILESFLDSAVTDILFRHAVWSYVSGVAKPSKRPFTEIQAHFPSIRHDQFVYIGNDMLNDVQGAASAGMKTILFAGDRNSLRLRKGDSRVSVRPDAIVTQLDDILTVLGRNVL